MSAITHAAYAEEHDRLQKTLEIIEDESIALNNELEIALSELKTAQKFDPDKLPVREMLFYKAQQGAKNMALAIKKPYFTRIDFTEKEGARNVYYIGKYGVMKSNTLESVVIDWRAPIANLYYSGQLGHVEYEAPDGRVSGELTLKRQLDISDGELLSIFDTEIVSQDAYLQSALSAMSGDRLKEIVTTIQAEQNFVIRHPLKTSLMVQGVAGSGKTTIALHRIAYLLYAFRDQLRPENMLILAPNPLFLNYIAGVLPDLGVENVRQTTFTRLISDWLGSALGKVDLSDRTERVLNAPENERNAYAAVARFKGSTLAADLIDEFLNDYERRFAPDAGITFGPVELFTKAEIDRFLLVDEKPFPMQRRVAEFKKQLTKRVNAAAHRVNAWFTTECDRRAALLGSQITDPAELRTKLSRLYKSRDERIQQTNDQVKPFIKQTIASFPSLDIRCLYRLFWEYIQTNYSCTPAAHAAKYTLRRIDEKKPLEQEDIAPIAYMAMRIMELPRFDMRHIVIDEAQDFNALEVQLLMRMMPSATFTIVGDVMQGIHAWRGITDWNMLSEGVFHSNCVMHRLVISYRNTVEIMETALNVARHRPTPGQTEAQPVIRHGEDPKYAHFASDKEQTEVLLDTIRKWQSEGMRVIAVIERRHDRVKVLCKSLNAVGAQILDTDASEYSGGVYVSPAAYVKGLEFDGVIIADAGESVYPDADLDARLLYVCLTRPLHKLLIMYSGNLTPLLS